MVQNLALAGIKQQGSPDIATIKQYRPEVMAAFFLLSKKMGEGLDALFLDQCPDIITSGYRDYSADPEVKHSPHNFALALDVQVSKLNARIPQNQPAILDGQIKWITAAMESKLFNRAGFYPSQNTIHLDIADDDWMKKHNGAKFWVKWNGKYTGFGILNEAIKYARSVIQS